MGAKNRHFHRNEEEIGTFFYLFPECFCRKKCNKASLTVVCAKLVAPKFETEKVQGLANVITMQG